MTARKIAIAATLVGLAISTPALSKVYFTVKELLSSHFKTADRVSFERVSLSGPQKKTLERRLGSKLPKTNYVVYVASKGGHPLGYAVFDQELGQHELIDFATFFDGAGKITRTEVTAYREGYGSEIRRDSFRRQFIGRDAHSHFRVGQDIDAISGATISSDSMARAVHRAALIVDVGVLSHGGT
jgi:Na+-translocating ferredoxin:NAD+ oxidoreductase RnfG subunit